MCFPSSVNLCFTYSWGIVKARYVRVIDKMCDGMDWIQDTVAKYHINKPRNLPDTRQTAPNQSVPPKQMLKRWTPIIPSGPSCFTSPCLHLHWSFAGAPVFVLPPEKELPSQESTVAQRKCCLSPQRDSRLNIQFPHHGDNLRAAVCIWGAASDLTWSSDTERGEHREKGR